MNDKPKSQGDEVLEFINQLKKKQWKSFTYTIFNANDPKAIESSKGQTDVERQIAELLALGWKIEITCRSTKRQIISSTFF